LQEPVLVEVARPNATATNVEQIFYSVTDDDKRGVVRQILRQRSITQALVFVNSKLGAARLARSFERDGLRTSALHGDKSQDERLKSLEAFKRGEVDVLVATDVAARGLDIADLPAVFNFDVPFNAEDYVHRIGRTGRAGASGIAVTLVTRSDARLVADLEKLLKRTIELSPIELEDTRPGARPERSQRAPREWDASPVDAQVDRAPRTAAAAAPVTPAAASRPVYRAPAASRDAFFDRPYEASASTELPAWDKGPAGSAAAPRGMSSNIRPKRKVAALFGAKRPVAVLEG
jgi:superfamily II DNA/RNA helicase